MDKNKDTSIFLRRELKKVLANPINFSELINIQRDKQGKRRREL